MFGGIDPALLIASLMVASVPIILAAIGELVVERAGVLNLGVEGMMIMGAVCGFIVSVQTGSAVLGFVGGALGGAAMALIFGGLTQFLLANQVASGLALTLFGLGLSSLMGQSFVGIRPPATGAVPLGPLADIPFFGRVLFSHDWVVYLSIASVAATWWMLKATRTGLILRAVGESHDAAHALGYKVRRIRMLAIMFGGAMAGLGGAYISMVRVPQWTDGITSGAGWIALAIVVFAAWRPWRALVGAYLFGGITVLQLNLQAAGARFPLETIPQVLVGLVAIDIARHFLKSLSISKKRKILWAVLVMAALPMFALLSGSTAAFKVEYLSMSPYLITILVLVIMSSGKGKAALNAPASLGQNFHASR